MRSVVLCATLAALLPSRAGAQSLSLTEADVLARLSVESPRVRAIRAATDVVRAEALPTDRVQRRILMSRSEASSCCCLMPMIFEKTILSRAPSMSASKLL